MKQIWPQRIFLLLVTAFLVYQSASASGQQKLEPLLPPHTLMGATKSPIVSPDHLYAARLTGGDAVPSFLSIYRVSGRHRQLVRPRIVDADSFIWVPHHPHLLAVAAGHGTDDSPAAQLSLWSGGQRLRELILVKDRELEGFEVDGATPDGKVLVYDHFIGGKVLINLRSKLPSP